VLQASGIRQRPKTKNHRKRKLKIGKQAISNNQFQFIKILKLLISHFIYPMKSIIFLTILTSLLFLFVINIIGIAPALGQSFHNPVAAIGDNPNIPLVVGRVIKIVLGIVGSIALVLFITAGFIWMTAKGEAAKIKKATDIMLWAAIGLVVIFSSYAILNFVFGIIK